MIFLRSGLYLLLATLCLPVFAGENGDWNGKRAAVVLTYDDSLNIHLDKVLPALDQREMKGTFYLTVNPTAFSSRMLEWREAAKNGHELGNHTLFHPCDGKKPNREWVSPDYDLSTYSVKRMVEEITLTNRILESVDGLEERTYAYTCGDTEAGQASFIKHIEPLFVGARGVANSMSKMGEVNLYNINAFFIFNHTAAQMIAEAERAYQEGALLVYLFHGVGGEHNLNIAEKEHTALLDYLKKNEDKYWITTMVEAARYAKKKQEN